MKHRELVDRAVHWMRASLKVELSLCEPTTADVERPDVIGWTSLTPYEKKREHTKDFGDYWASVAAFPYAGVISHVVECKTSRRDFLADRAKAARKGGDGMGTHRWFFCGAGCDWIHVGDLPAGWGLVLLGEGNRPTVLRKPTPFVLSETAHQRERTLLLSAARRAIHNWASNAYEHPTSPRTIDDLRCLRSLLSPPPPAKPVCGTCGGDGEIPYATHAGGFAPDFIPCPACTGDKP